MQFIYNRYKLITVDHFRGTSDDEDSVIRPQCGTPSHESQSGLRREPAHLD